MPGSRRLIFLLVFSFVFLLASFSRAGVVFSVSGSTTAVCPNTTNTAFGNVYLNVASGGTVPAGSYLQVSLNYPILTGTPTMGGSLTTSAAFTVSGSVMTIVFPSSATFIAGDSLWIMGLQGNAPATDTTIIATVTSSSGSGIGFTNTSQPICSVSSGLCSTSGHMATSVTSLGFGGPLRTLIQPQSFTVTNSSHPGSNLSIAVSVVYPGSGPTAWLTAVAGVESAGVTTVTVSVDTTGLSQTTYTANVRIDSALADNSPQLIPVILTIGKPGRIDLSTTKMTFVAQPGKNPPSQNLVVANGGTGVLAPEASAVMLNGGAWMFVSDVSTEVAPTVYQVNIASAGMQLGTYNGTITIYSDSAFNSPQTVAVQLIVKSPTPTIALTPQSLAFTSDQGTSPATQTFTVNNSDTGDLTWQGQVTTGDGGNWLTLSPSSGTAPTPVTASVSAANLAAGTYNATITITSYSDSVTNSPQKVSVTLTVNAVNPGIGLTTSSLSFTADAGTNPPAQSLTVSNSGTGTLAWTAAVSTDKGGNWLAITPASGSGSTNVQVTVSSSALAIGSYTGKIVITSLSPSVTNSPQTIPVTLLVRGTTPLIIVNPASLKFATLPGGGAPASQTVSLDNGGAGTLMWTATVSTVSGGNWLIVSPASGTAPNTLTVTIDNSGLGLGRFAGSILIRASGAPDVTIPVEFTTGLPKINDKGVVNAAHQASAGLAPGGLIAIFGSNLAGVSRPALPIPYLPDEISGTSVKIGTFKAKLLFVSPTQINAQVPVELTDATAQVKVSVGGLETDPVTLNVMPYDPGLFTFDGSPAGPTAALHADYTAVNAASPAQRGSVIMLFGTGFGPVYPAVTSGQPGSAKDPLNQTVQTPIVLFGGRGGSVVSSGLAPTLTGVYQVNVVVPSDAPTGDSVPVIVGIGGRGTNTATISVR